MPGADGVSVAEFAQRLGPRLEALAGLLRLVPVVRGGRTRDRGVPTVADRIVQRAFLHAYGNRLDTATSEVSFAYQRGRSWVDALAQARRYGESGLRWVFRTDIADFFDSIDHPGLLEVVARTLPEPDVVDLVRGWITAPILTGGGLRHRSSGVPEGAPVSPTLANLYLRSFDRSVDGRYGRLVRYADDLALFCGDLNAAIAGAEHILLELAGLGLRANVDKTYFGSFDAGFRMLGWVFSGATGWPEDERPGWTHPLVNRTNS